MMKKLSTQARTSVWVVLLAVLSAMPYATVYATERLLGVSNAAVTAMWPALLTPVLLAAVVATYLARTHTGRSVAQPVMVRPRNVHDRTHAHAA